MPAPLGQLLELAIPTRDIAASVLFYERLAFSQRLTGDAWPHPYGVLGDGRIHLGLHQLSSPDGAQPREAVPLLEGPTPCFVHPELARHAEQLREHGLYCERRELRDDSLHHLWLRDPGGNALLMQEARTFSPGDATGTERSSATPSLCGYFLQLSLPQPDFAAALQFWERAGFVGLPEQAAPYAHQPLTSDQLELAFHAPHSCDAPLLVFEVPDLQTTRTRLAAQGILPATRLPRALQASGNLLLQAPEGTLLLLVPTS